MPYTKSIYSLFVSTPTFPLMSTPTDGPCDGQVVEPDSEIYSCKALAKTYHVSFGDVVVATGNEFCQFSASICLPLPCETLVVEKYGESCASIRQRISNSTHRVTQEQLIAWNPYLRGRCDGLALGQHLCIRYPCSITL